MVELMPCQVVSKLGNEDNDHTLKKGIPGMPGCEIHQLLYQLLLIVAMVSSLAKRAMYYSFFPDFRTIRFSVVIELL